MMKAILLIVSLFLLVGCGPTIVNNTPNPMPANASGIYTISMGVKSEDGSVLKESFEPKVVIDGQARTMTRSQLGRNTFDYDFMMPEGRREAKYYFVLDYLVDYTGSPSERQVQTDLYDLKLINRYVINTSQRGPVGAEIPVVGSGFSRYDTITIGGIEADTEYHSPTSLSFVVPPLMANTAYPAVLLGSSGEQYIGEFFIDASRMRVTPKTLQLKPGERSTLSFAIDFDAPAGGVPVDVTTDVPQSIIMPEVLIPAGSRSVTIPVEGGKPGSGSLFVSARGFNEQNLPLSISEAAADDAAGDEASAPTIEEQGVSILQE